MRDVFPTAQSPSITILRMWFFLDATDPVLLGGLSMFIKMLKWINLIEIK